MFEVSNTRMFHDAMPAGPHCSLNVQCDVRNSGSRTAKRAVQVYIAFPRTSIGRPRPRKELKAFKKVALTPGETKTLEFVQNKYSINIYDATNSCWKALAGEFRVQVGLNTANESTFVVEREFSWIGV